MNKYVRWLRGAIKQIVNQPHYFVTEAQAKLAKENRLKKQSNKDHDDNQKGLK